MLHSYRDDPIGITLVLVLLLLAAHEPVYATVRMLTKTARSKARRKG